jgi:hypothetical protein
MTMSTSRILWLTAAALYALFWFWYTPLGGPLTDAEVRHYLERFERDGADPVRLEQLHRFMTEDSGTQFIMVNLLDMADAPIELPATGPGAPADALLDHYMEHMYPALLLRACHPVFAGAVVGAALDVTGIEGADKWSRVALMRYRSRRDMLEIATDPAFDARHPYKLAALDKTVAVPVETQLYLSDPRLLLALGLLALAGLPTLIRGVRRPS